MKDKKFIQPRHLNKLALVMIDFVLLALTYVIVIWVSQRLGHNISSQNSIVVPLAIIAVTLATFIFLGIYKILLIHISFEDLLRLTSIVFFKNIILALFFLIFKDIKFVPWPVFFLIAPLELSLLIAPRIVVRMHKYLRAFIYRNKGIRTLIIGAGSGGTIVFKEIQENPELNYYVVGFVDDDEAKINSKLNGVKIYGPISEITNIIKKLKVKEVIIAIANLKPRRLSSLVEDLTEVNVKSKKIVVLSDVNEDKPIQLVDIKIEDLLNRIPVELDNKEIENFIKNKTVLVTGGGGSIGSELCRQIIDHQPQKLIIFDIYENTTYDIQMELKRKFYKNTKIKEPKIEVIIGSVYNKARVKSVLEEHRPEIIFHAAAYKHVPLMEDSAVEAIRTNILGTYNVATLADEYSVEKMVLVSTDKAVRPTNIMGATKRTAENIIQYQNSIAKHTSYSAVRFGNVLGSSGSVIPLFTKQIADGGPLTVTHKDITRYFMTIPESVSLILLSGVFAKDGEIFVLDMGESVKILDLAERMIRLMGYQPYKDIEIEFTGLRPGEKLYEEILIDPNLDSHKPTPNSKIFIESESFLTFEELKIDKIIKTLDNLSNEEAKDLVKEIIDTYKENNEVNGK